MLTNYKYRTGEAASRCLSEGILYFAPPAKLNDILEAKFETPPVEDFLDEFLVAVRELATQRGFSADSVNLQTHDPALLYELAEVDHAENVRFKEACQEVGIFSATVRPDHQALWAYYASDFKGVCFELEWPNEVLETYQIVPVKVQYSAKHRILNRATDVKELLIKVASSNPTWSMDELMRHTLSEDFRRRIGIASVSRAVSIKHADWAHEEEIRLISPHPCKVPICDVLKKVFYVRYDSPELELIIGAIHRHYPNVKLVELKFSHVPPLVSAREFEVKIVPN